MFTRMRKIEPMQLPFLNSDRFSRSEKAGLFSCDYISGKSGDALSTRS